MPGCTVQAGENRTWSGRSGYVVGSPITAAICYKFKSLRSLVVGGFVFLLAWAICMATTSLCSTSAVWGCQAILGAALAFILNAVVASAQLSAPPELMSVETPQ